MPRITKINELDCKIQGNLNRLDSSMHKIVKTLETIKFHDLESSMIDKIEEVINMDLLSPNQNKKGINSGKRGT